MVNIALEVECSPGLRYYSSLFIGSPEHHVFFQVIKKIVVFPGCRVFFYFLFVGLTLDSM